MRKAYYIVPTLVVIFSVSVLFGTMRKVVIEKDNLDKQVLSIQNEQKSSVTYIINYGNDKMETTKTFEKNLSVLKLLQAIAKENSITLDIVTSSFGAYVNGINGITGTKEKAWLLYINGAPANKGADNININPGDTIEWKYQSC